MYTDSRSVFSDEEVRRQEALSQAVMSDQTGNAGLIVNTAKKFEKYLKEGETNGTD